MSLIRQQDDLKGLSDGQLGKEMQQPTGMFPQFLVLSEMRRRGELRSKYGDGIEPSGTTVADDTIAALGSGGPPAPQAQVGPMIRQPAGIPGMPQQQTFPQNQAVGLRGLVAGGRVSPQRYAAGIATLPQGNVLRSGATAGDFPVGDTTSIGRVGDEYPTMLTPETMGGGIMQGIRMPGETRGFQYGGGIGTDPRTSPRLRPLTDERRLGRQPITGEMSPEGVRLSAEAAERARQVAQWKTLSDDPGGSRFPSYPAPTTGEYDSRFLSPPAAPPPATAVATGPAGVPRVTRGAAGNAVLAGGTGQPAVAPTSIEDMYAAQLAKLQGTGGISPYADERAELARMREKMASNTAQDKNFLMMQAGLGIAGGRSPYPLANLQGALPALSDYQNRQTAADQQRLAYLSASTGLTAAELAGSTATAEQAMNLVKMQETQRQHEETSEIARQEVAVRTRQADASFLGSKAQMQNALTNVFKAEQGPEALRLFNAIASEPDPAKKAQYMRLFELKHGGRHGFLASNAAAQSWQRIEATVVKALAIDPKFSTLATGSTAEQKKYADELFKRTEAKFRETNTHLTGYADARVAARKNAPKTRIKMDSASGLSE